MRNERADVPQVKTPAVLLLHGFCGDREEVHPLAEALRTRGYEVSVPLLAGHGGGKHAMRGVGHADWITSAYDAYLALAAQHGKVAVIGFSMGGLIAAQLYARRPFDALITLNTPAAFWNFPQIFRNLRQDFRFYLHKYTVASTDKTVGAMISFLRLLNGSKPLVAHITCPVLVVQTEDDDTAHPRSAAYWKKLLDERTQLLRYPDGGHTIAHTRHVSDLAARIDAFLQRI